MDAMKSQILHTVWCNITCEAAGGIWTWSLLRVKGLSKKDRRITLQASFILFSPFVYRGGLCLDIAAIEVKQPKQLPDGRGRYALKRHVSQELPRTQPRGKNGRRVSTTSTRRTARPTYGQGEGLSSEYKDCALLVDGVGSAHRHFARISQQFTRVSQ